MAKGDSSNDGPGIRAVGRAPSTVAGPEASTPAATVPRRPAPPVPPSPDEHPTKTETEALQARRAHKDIQLPLDAPKIGLALSGGGIRSATFCLGLLRGFARNKVLKRFDYLSTVSGGGYTGAMFGRLVQREGIADAEEILADDDTATLSWLRRYGRYLAPGGARDYGVGIATFLRAVIAMHLEFAMAALLLALVPIVLHVAQSQYKLLVIDDGWMVWKSAQLPFALLFWTLLAPGLITLYWVLPRDRRDGRPAHGWLGAMLISGAVLGGICAYHCLIGVKAWDANPSLPGASPQFLAGLALSGAALQSLVGAAWLGANRYWRDDTATFATQAQLRLHLTLALRCVNVWAVGIALLGLVDWWSWELFTTLQHSRNGLFGSFGMGALLLLLVRAVAGSLQDRLQTADARKFNALPMLINVAGFAVAFALLVAWAAVAQWVVFGEADADDAHRWARIWWLTGGVVIWFLATSAMRESVNASSLHPMYCARLVRAYLGAVNPARFDVPLTSRVSMGQGVTKVDVTDLHPGDDVSLADYDPSVRGGPLHLINICLNQTRGLDTGLYNADRKGVPLMVSAYGVQAGGRPLSVSPATVGTLGRCVAISGAVASPGAGAYTTPGWAALLFLAGVRVGYWLDVGKGYLRHSAARTGCWAGFKRWLALTKFGRLHAEFSASFHGPFARDWHLSDGGHFDNTGVYPLLQRRLDFIVLADCGADPRYEYADLENLVRKARIDHGADIEFYTSDAARKLLAEPAAGADRDDPDITFLSPERLADNFTARGVLCARILYRAEREGAPRAQGLLLVVKPNLHEALDMDLLAYARRNQSFPQQTTGDQFFDEAQWESYRRLGEDFAAHLRPGWLSRLPGWSASIPVQAKPAPIRRCRLHVHGATGAARPFWRIDAKGAAVGVLSVGALVALVTPVSDAVGTWRENHRAAQSDVDDARRQVQALLPLAQSGEGLSLEQRTVIEKFNALSEELDDGSPADRRARDIESHINNACEEDNRTDFCDAARKKQEISVISDSQKRYWDFQLGPNPAGDSGNAQPATPPPLAGPTLQATAPDGRLKSWVVQLTPRPRRSTQAGLSAGELWWKRPVAAFTMVPHESNVAADVLKAGTVVDGQTWTACDALGRIELYVQVYDEASRDQLKAIQWATVRDRVRMPGIENVSITASVRGLKLGAKYATPTFVLHRKADEECAKEIAAWLKSQTALQGQPSPEFASVALPRGYTPQPRVMELWWPPP